MPFFHKADRTIRVLPIALCVAILSAVGLAHAGDPVTVIDARGRQVVAPQTGRILTLGPDVTEIVYALGEGGRIAALDRSSRFPPDTANKVNLGYRRQLSAEGVIATNPDLILASEDIGPPEMIEVLQTLQIPVVFVPDENSSDGIARKIALLASVLSREAEGERLAAKALAELAEARALTQAIADDERRKVIFLHGLARLTAAGAGTAGGTIISLSGGRNVMEETSGYKIVSEERLVELAPDLVVMMSDGRGGPTADEVFANRALAATPAGQTRSLVVLDGAYMTSFGPRTAAAVRDLATAFYGDRLD